MIPRSSRLVVMTALATALVIAFIRPICDLVRLSLSSDLYSYIPLVPLIGGYLIWADRKTLPPVFNSSPFVAMIPLSAGLLLVVTNAWGKSMGWNPEASDYLALMVVSLILMLAAACLFVLGKATLRVIAFPAALMLFAAPIPSHLHDWIEQFLQNASADAAHLLFLMSGTAVFREGLIFHLPGFSFEVAPECSGIHSTLVLLITGLLAGYLFLRTVWMRTLLVLAVLPVALLRNGIRIFVIGQLCVHIGPDMIHSYIHRHGGPIFFVLSLIPLCILLMILQGTESRRQATCRMPSTPSTEPSP